MREPWVKIPKQKTTHNEVYGLKSSPILMCTKHSPFTGIF